MGVEVGLIKYVQTVNTRQQVTIWYVQLGQ
jgi:hypothetical protein